MNDKTTYSQPAYARWLYLACLLLMLGLCSWLFFWALSYSNVPIAIIPAASFVFLLGLGIYYSQSTYRVHLSDAGIDAENMLGTRKHIAWEDIAAVRRGPGYYFGGSESRLDVVGRDGKLVRLLERLRGFEEVRAEIERRASQGGITPTTVKQ